MSTVTRRAVTPDDESFLYTLFKAVRMPEFASAAIAPEQLEALMRMQYNGQRFSYSSQYPSGHELVLIDGEPAGQLWVYPASDAHYLVDISLMPEHRNRGIGSGLLKEVIAAAREAGAELRCSVALTNPRSLTFHQRLGFRIVGQDEMYYELSREP